MPKLWFFTGIGVTSQPLLDIPPDVSGLKDWIESHIGYRPGWPDQIDTRWAPDGSTDLTLELRFRLRIVDEVTALTLVAKAEMDK
jgi:hypothetical protein